MHLTVLCAGFLFGAGFVVGRARARRWASAGSQVVAVRNEQLRKEKEKLKWEFELLKELHHRQNTRAHTSPKDVETLELDNHPIEQWSKRRTPPKNDNMPLFSHHINVEVCESISSVDSSLVRATPSLVSSSVIESPKTAAKRGPPFAPLLGYGDPFGSAPPLPTRRANARIPSGKFA
jgi:hypothetical protein